MNKKWEKYYPNEKMRVTKQAERRQKIEQSNNMAGIINRNVEKPIRDKTEVNKELKARTNQKELKSLLAPISYLSIYISNF